MRGQAKLSWIFGLIFIFNNGIAWASSTEYSGAMIQELLYRTINFIALIIIITFLTYKPIKKSLNDRIKNIKDELTKLEKHRNEAQKELNDIKIQLKNTENEHEKILANFRIQGEKERTKIITIAEASATRIKAQAKFTIDQESILAISELRKEISQLGVSLAEKILKQKITTDDQTKLINEYLAKVQQEVQ